MGIIKAKYLNTDTESTLKLRSDIILAAAKNYQPDLVLVDKKPLGIQGELKPTINYLNGKSARTKFVLLLRDILDIPEKTIQEWDREGYTSIIESIYDRLLVVGMPEIFDMVQEYQFKSTIAAKVRYCGYIRKESELKNPRMVRQELGIKTDEKFVLVTPGGGEDGYELIHNYLTGLAQQQADIDQYKIHSLILCGAEMPAEQQQHIQQQAQALSGVTVLEFTEDIISYVNAADVVICMGGYNTITEVLQKGKKAIVVPRIKPGREQLIRAQRLQNAGLIKMIHPEQLTPDLLIKTLCNNLTLVHDSQAIKHLDFEGLPRVADYLAMLLFDTFLIHQGSDIT